jgi:hypothetical protein
MNRRCFTWRPASGSRDACSSSNSSSSSNRRVLVATGHEQEVLHTAAGIRVQGCLQQQQQRQQQQQQQQEQGAGGPRT